MEQGPSHRACNTPRTCPVNVTVITVDAAVLEHLPCLLAESGTFRWYFEADVSKIGLSSGATRMDAIIFDMHLPGGGELAHMKVARARLPGATIVALTMRDYPEYVAACFDHGADHVIDKSGDLDVIARHMQSLHDRLLAQRGYSG